MIDFLVGLRGGPKTVITSTHDLDIIEDIADRCIVFQAGRIVAVGTPAEILSQTTLLQETNLVRAASAYPRPAAKFTRTRISIRIFITHTAPLRVTIK